MSRPLALKSSVATFVLACAACAWLWASDAPVDNKKTPDVGKLIDRIEKLEARLAGLEVKLEAEIVKLRASRTPIVITPSAPQLPSSAVPPTSPVPKGWKAGEINGMPYYIVPLEASNGVHQLLKGQ